MKKNLFTISESEKNRIINLHKTATKNLYLSEQTPSVAVKPRYETENCTSKGLKTPPCNEQVLKIQIKMNDECPKDILGVKLKEDGVDGGKTFTSFGKCKGNFTKKVVVTDVVDTKTSFLVNGVKKTYNSSEEITQAFNSGELNMNTKVWSPDLKDAQGNSLPWSEIKNLPPDSILAKQFKLITSKVAPDTPTESKTFKISVDGRTPAVSYTEETLSNAIKDGTLTKTSQIVVVNDQTGETRYEPISTNKDTIKIYNLAVGPQSITQSRKTTGVKELDDWLQTDFGKGWDKITDPKQKEGMLDAYEKSDPTIKSLVSSLGKNKVRAALGVGADTKLGRGIQNIRQKVGSAITGTQPQV